MRPTDPSFSRESAAVAAAAAHAEPGKLAQSHHIFFQLILFPSLQQLRTHAENAEGRSP